MHRASDCLRPGVEAAQNGKSWSVPAGTTFASATIGATVMPGLRSDLDGRVVSVGWIKERQARSSVAGARACNPHGCADPEQLIGSSGSSARSPYRLAPQKPQKNHSGKHFSWPNLFLGRWLKRLS